MPRTPGLTAAARRTASSAARILAGVSVMSVGTSAVVPNLRWAAAHRRFGTTALVPTLITDTPAKMRAALDAVRRAAAVNPGVLGIHFEGPFLSPAKPGVHDPAMIRRPDAQDC